jgi:hypothetical protein
MRKAKGKLKSVNVKYGTRKYGQVPNQESKIRNQQAL